MGGRGSSSARHGKGSSPTVRLNALGIQVGEGRNSKLTNETLTMVADTVEQFYKDHPSTRGMVEKILGDSETPFKIKNTEAFARFVPVRNKTVIVLNEKKFSDLKALETEHERSAQSMFHPRNTKASDTIYHELGHAATTQWGLNTGLIQQNGMFNKTAVKSKKQRMQTHVDVASQRIMKHAMPIAEKLNNESAHPIRFYERTISKYATTSNSEAIAEAFTDVRRNGKKAHPLSQAIVQVVDNPKKYHV